MSETQLTPEQVDDMLKEIVMKKDASPGDLQTSTLLLRNMVVNCMQDIKNIMVDFEKRIQKLEKGSDHDE